MTGNNIVLVNLETPVFNGLSEKQVVHSLPKKGFRGIRGGFSLPLRPIMEDPCALAVRALICAKEIEAVLRGEEIQPSPCGCLGRDI